MDKPMNKKKTTTNLQDDLEVTSSAEEVKA
jgi:hypothetical protein